MDTDEKKYIRKNRIEEYLDNLRQQVEHLEKLPVSDVEFLTGEENFERIQAVKFKSCLCYPRCYSNSSSYSDSIGSS